MLRGLTHKTTCRHSRMHTHTVCQVFHFSCYKKGHSCLFCPLLLQWVVKSLHSRSPTIHPRVITACDCWYIIIMYSVSCCFLFVCENVLFLLQSNRRYDFISISALHTTYRSIIQHNTLASLAQIVIIRQGVSCIHEFVSLGKKKKSNHTAALRAKG